MVPPSMTFIRIIIRRLRFSSDADIVRLTNARIIIIIIDPWQGFQGHDIFRQCWISQKRHETEPYSYYSTSLGSQSLSIEWWHFPHWWEPIPNIWNGTMFGDLDWPLNASRSLSAITEFFVCITNQCNALTGNLLFLILVPWWNQVILCYICATFIATLISLSSVYAEQKRQQLTIYVHSTDVACPSSGWMTDTTWCSRQLPPHHVNIMHPLA